MDVSKRLIILIVAFSIISCKLKDYRVKNAHYFNITKELDFIKSNIVNSPQEEFQILISYGHNSINRLSSNISIKKDSIKLRTQTISSYKENIDTSFSINKSHFFEELLYQRKEAKNLIILAGHYQNITLKRDTSEIRYPTTRIAGLLIELLEKGKLHYK